MATSKGSGKLGIVVGGGPAPGINSVIAAATIRAADSGVEVVGIVDGYSWLMKGDTAHTMHLAGADVSRIHFRGGSHLGIARANPTKDAKLLETTLQSLETLHIDKLISIGGDDTCFSAHKLAELATKKGRSLAVVHVPKTIDNDLDLPQDSFTFGFQTARALGVSITANLMVDAETTSRWYFVVAMGRKAGHLALGIGKAAGATITLIPEEFPLGKGEHLRLATLVDTLVGSIVKRLAQGRSDGVAVLAEGLVEMLEEKDLEGLAAAERDEHGHLRIAEIDFGRILKQAVQKRLGELGMKLTIVSKDIGYELRCADPIPFDMEYTRDLGYCAARYVTEGGRSSLISIEAGRFKPIPFADIMDAETGRMKVRMVDVESDRYKIARSYMTRLHKADLDDKKVLGRLAAATKLDAPGFARAFGPLVEHEPAPLKL